MQLCFYYSHMKGTELKAGMGRTEKVLAGSSLTTGCALCRRRGFGKEVSDLNLIGHHNLDAELTALHFILGITEPPWKHLVKNCILAPLENSGMMLCSLGFAETKSLQKMQLARNILNDSGTDLQATYT